VIDPDCKVCLGVGWVCESHPQRAWTEELGCQCGAGMPCECVCADGLQGLADLRSSCRFIYGLAVAAFVDRKLVASDLIRRAAKLGRRHMSMSGLYRLVCRREKPPAEVARLKSRAAKPLMQ
jgi:hypothetical protein